MFRNVTFCLFILSGCTGTDFINDPIVGESISLTDETIALMPGETKMVSASYFDQYGIEQNVALNWESSNPLIADISAVGLLTAKAVGQTTIQPHYNNFLGPQIQVTVVSDPNLVARVEITPPTVTALSIGQKIQLDASVQNFNGFELINEPVDWFSENSSIVTVNQSGEVEAIGNGVAAIHAKANGVRSNNVVFTVAGTVRTATFVAAGGYKTSGTARLEVITNELILTLSSNFDTDFALGTYVYLANSTNGGVVRSSGLEIARIFNDGGATFNVSLVNNSVKISDYRYVIILCKPASVTFGFGDLN